MWHAPNLIRFGEAKFVFNDIIHSEILSFVYQWFHKLVPSCFLDFFNPISSIHKYPTRQSLNENLFIKSIRTTQYGIRSLHYTGSNLWNSLPITIKQITPFSRFRKINTFSINCLFNTVFPLINLVTLGHLLD